MRVVLDSNVLLAAFGTRGACEVVLTVCLAGHELILSDHIINEFSRHLAEKFRRVSQADALAAAEFLRGRAEIVKPELVPEQSCRDPDDLPVLGTATAGKAQVLVTGDKDLLDLSSYRGIEIITPRQFMDRLQN